jgi:hypothetical protein
VATHTLRLRLLGTGGWEKWRDAVILGSGEANRQPQVGERAIYGPKIDPTSHTYDDVVVESNGLLPVLRWRLTALKLSPTPWWNRCEACSVVAVCGGALRIGVALAGVLAGCGSSSRGASMGGSLLGSLAESSGSGSAAGNPAPSMQITVSSLGGIRLGEAKAGVDVVLGSGTPAPRSGGLSVVGYPAAAMVVTFKNGRVFSIATGDARYHTAQGVGVGSAADEVKKPPNVSCIDLGSGAFDCKADESGGSGSPPEIDFQGGRQREGRAGRSAISERVSSPAQ